jgi:hypothetical protein
MTGVTGNLTGATGQSGTPIRFTPSARRPLWQGNLMGAAGNLMGAAGLWYTQEAIARLAS